MKKYGKKVIDASFIEESIHATLLGAEFDVYSESRMSDFVITNIEWDEEKRTSGEVYISDSIDGIWKLSRKYMTKEQKKLREEEI